MRLSLKDSWIIFLPEAGPEQCPPAQGWQLGQAMLGTGGGMSEAIRRPRRQPAAPQA